MKRDMIEIDWEILGARLARLSTDEQIPFFRGFANEMNKYPTHYEKEMQLTYIREGMNGDGMTKEQKEVYEYLGYKPEDTGQ